MRKVTIVALALLCLMIFVGCQKYPSEATLRVYLIEGDGKSSDVHHKKLLFTDNDIETYDWQNHEIVFTKTFLETKNKHTPNEDKNPLDSILTGGSKFFGTKQGDKFLVTLDEEVIYEGSFPQAVVSSYMPVGAVLIDTDQGVKITFVEDPQKDKDPRNDERIKKLLEEKKKLTTASIT